MATVIDSLIVTLGLDDSKYDKGMKKAIKDEEKLGHVTKREDLQRRREKKKQDEERRKQERRKREDLKHTIEGYKRIRSQLLAIGGLFMAGMGIKKFAQFEIGNTANLGRMAAVTGMSAKELSGWALAAENAGGSGQEMMKTVMSLSQQVAAFHFGQTSSGIREFLRFGGDASKLKDAKSYLLAMSTLLQHISATKGKKAAWAVASGQLGLNFAQFNMLRRGPNALMRQIRDNEKLTGVTAAQAREARKSQIQWNQLEASLENVGRMVLFDMMPAFREIMKELEKLAIWMAAHKKEVREWGKEFAMAVENVAKAIGYLMKFMNKYGPEIHAISKISAFATPFLHPIQSAQAALGLGRMAGSSFHNAQTHIGTVIVHTKATDAVGIAADIGKELGGHKVAVQSNRGMS